MVRISCNKDWFLNKWRETNVVSLVVVLLWIAGGIMTLTIPVGNWNSNKMDYYGMYGRYVEYENQQRAYEEGQNQNDNNNDNNNGYTYPECKWYQWQCRKSQYLYRIQYGGGDRNDMVSTPNWYHFIGGSDGEADRRFFDEMGISYDADSSTGAMKFVYAWNMIMFIGMLIYGTFVLSTGRSVLGLVVLCAVFAQFSLLQIVLCGQGVISSDNRDLEDTIYGWYGQHGVLQVYTDFAYVIFCATFCVLFALLGILRICADRYGWRWARSFGSANNNQVAREDEADPDVEHGGYTTPAVYKNLE